MLVVVAALSLAVLPLLCVVLLVAAGVRLEVLLVAAVVVAEVLVVWCVPPSRLVLCAAVVVLLVAWPFCQ